MMMKSERSTRWNRCLVGTLALASLLAGSEAQIELDICLPALVQADGNENSRLSGLEYVHFVNNVTHGEYGFTSYEELPEPLVMNFEIYDQGAGVIDIQGATLGENATRRQKRVVETLCETTDMALDVVPPPEIYRGSSLNETASTSENSNSSMLADSNESEMKTQTDEVLPPNDIVSEQTNSTNASSNETAQVNFTVTSPPEEETPAPTTTSNTSASTSLTDEVSVTTEPTSNNSTDSAETTAAPSEASNATDPNITSTASPSAPTPVTETLIHSIEGNTTSAEPNTTTTETEYSSPTVAPTEAGTPATVPTMAANASEVLAFNSTNATEPVEDILPDSPTQSPSAAPSRDPFSECKRVMTFSDIDQDGIMSEVEYVWFVNDNWNNPYPGVAFPDLPEEMKESFYSFASNGEINIAMLNSEDPMSNDQEQFLERICTETEVALSLSETDGESDQQEASMTIFEQCLEQCLVFDENADSWLDYAEYASLINELSHQSFGLGTFEDLPDALKEAFYSLAISATIDLGGAKHGTTLSNSQQEIVENICVDTSYALEKVSNSATLDATDTNTMLEYAACFMGMNEHDLNTDLKLDEAEYSGLVNLMGQNRFQNVDFQDLPLVLQDNFLNLQTNDTINIAGSQDGEVPDKDQQHFLSQVCSETTEAVNMAIAMGIPETSPPILPEGESLTIHSSFNIYSDVSISDEEFDAGATTRTALEEAYRQFVMKVVDGLKEESGQEQSIGRQAATQGPPLTVIDRDSPSIDYIVDLSCAGASEGAICKTIFATYEIIPMEGNMDRQALYDEYVRVTQSSIDGGMLQAALERVDPATALTVIGASEPVVYASQAPAQSPVNSIPLVTDDDDGYEERMENNEKKTIAFVAVGVGCLLVASLIGLIMARYRKQKAAKMSGSSSQANSAASSVGKASETHDEFQQEGKSQSSHRGSISGSTGSGHSSRIFRTRNDVTNDDEELGKMQVVDLDLANCEGITAASNDFEAISQKHMRKMAREDSSRGDIPPLRKQKQDERESQASDQLSMAFRRYAIDGGENQQADEDGMYGI